MARFFNTTGPCNPEKHYILPPEARLVRAQLDRYIGDELYWVLHAPRQSGKTTFLQSWMRKINAEGKALACYVSVERCQEFPDAADAIPAVCAAIREYADAFIGPALTPALPQAEPASALSAILKDWAALVAPKPLVVLFDEVDVLQDQALVSFLRQLRGGFAMRGIGTFPVSVALVGMRDLRDYLIRSKDGVALNPGSPFNIKEDSATLSSFSAEDVRGLVGQHSAETGQVFSVEAMALVYELTRGQPWLVNALCKKCVWQLCPKGEPVGVDQIEAARELLIQERAVHLDSLVERLRDPRVKRIVQSIMVGESDPTLTNGDDFRLTLDLGLVTMERGSPAIANPIYRETIARVLSQGMQDAIPAPEFRWQRPDGSLDMEALLREFQRFWRRHADLWEEKADYTEAFPHLLLMAFLQRVVNGGGRIEREYAAGRGRMDLAILYGGAWSIIEIKLVHPGDGRAATVAEGLGQVLRYRDSIDRGAGAWLVIFDRTPAGRQKSWEERLTWEVRETPGAVVTVVGG
ncbi:MAG TPA: ATP-binding protein [Rectinemataceae bacterium]|nr:ATP-binding protein [Rectinemataceae bacterium]